MDPQSMSTGSGEDGSDGNDSTSAPSEFFAECMSASLRRHYSAALRYCQLILQHEPRNKPARALLPLLLRRAHTPHHAPHTKPQYNNEQQEEDVAVVEQNSESSSTSLSLPDGSGSESSRAMSSDDNRTDDNKTEDCRSEDAVSECISELELESSSDDAPPLDDSERDQCSSYSCVSSRESSETGSSGGAVCDDNGNTALPPPPPPALSVADLWNDNVPFETDSPRSNNVTLDNAAVSAYTDYHLNRSCAH